MEMAGDIAQWLQITLRGLAVDEDSCASVIGGKITEIPSRSVARWQFGLDMIFRLNKSGLTYFQYFIIHPNDVAELFQTLQSSNPFFGVSGFVWNGTYVGGTDRLVALIEKHFPSSQPYDASLNAEFVQEVEDIFQSSEVPWSIQPLLPIVQ
jgi:hypothetical protein